MEFRPFFEEADSYKTVGFTWRGSDNTEIPPLWGQFDEKLGPLVDQSPSMLSFGICRDMDETGTFSYMVGITLGPEMSIADGLEIWEIPSGRWAVFTTPLSNIHDCYHYIMGSWSKESGEVLRDGPTIERYPAGFDGAPHEQLEILLPIN